MPLNRNRNGIWFVITLFLISCSVISITKGKTKSSSSFESLSKYSYLVFGIKVGKPINNMYPYVKKQGTCFFIRHANKIFLVSAMHVFVPESLSESKGFPDEFVLKLYDKSGNIAPYKLDMRKIRKPNILGNYLTEPDVIAFEFTDTAKYQINSIESFIDNDLTLQSQGLIFYGFPIKERDDSLPNFDSLFTRSPDLTTGKLIAKEQLPQNFGNNIDSDTINYPLLRSDTLKKQGCSGSPVMISDGKSWKFGGVLIRAGIDNPYGLIVKYRYVLNKLNS